MIVPDVNMLLYAEIDACPAHPAARRWWEQLLNGERRVGIAPAAAFGFVRISTNRRVFAEPLAVGDALARVQRWLDRPQVSYLVPGTRHLGIAFDLLRRLGTAANLTTDVQLAAHAIELGGELHSNDGDFGRFDGLRWVNPLAL
ncbi:MAG: type II toxin-antitoxin system VapC family toxin [Deltaproteobacteria bacterium]|nr:type II toxin-antitoxin system VapC family toxin [Deltaproteobacteria bacterium]